MTILTNTQISGLVQSNNLIAGFDQSSLQPASYDLRIGTIFRDGQIINSGSAPIIIKPGELVTMLTKEELHLPSDIAGTAYAINKQSSAGLLVLNPGHVDPGYKGPLSMVALNLRRVPLPLHLNEPIFTVVFNQLQQSANPAYSGSSKKIADREIEVNKNVVEKSMVSISDLISMDSRFVTESKVGHLILVHWSTWLVTIAALVAAVFAVISVYQPTLRNDQVSQYCPPPSVSVSNAVPQGPALQNSSVAPTSPAAAAPPTPGKVAPTVPPVP